MRNKMFRKYKDILSVKELQEALGIGKSKAYELLESGEISSFRIGSVYKISKIALIEYIAKNSN